MKDLVGAEVPTAEQVEESRAPVRASRENLARFLINLSSDERKRLARMRTGGESIVRLIARLVRKYNVSLPGLDVDAMIRDLETGENLESLADELATYARSVEDTVMEANSEAWSTATAFYAALLGASRASVDLKVELQPVIDFFARRRRSGGTPSGDPNA